MGIFNPFNYFTSGEQIVTPTPPVEPGLVEYLIVGGGGAGGKFEGGGGGGGAVLSGSFTPMIGRRYIVTIGGGGNINDFINPSPPNPQNGMTSSLFSVVAVGGGRGANTDDWAANSGASGGGGNYFYTTPGDGIYPFGNRGGLGLSTPTFLGGGGGGVLERGEDASSTPNEGGKGGDGIASSIRGTLTYYGGGGGGVRTISGTTTPATGGLGGGGNGYSLVSDATNGLPNTGGGGGGDGGIGAPFGFGGSGIVVVRYKTSEMSAVGGDITIDGDYTIHSFTGSGAMYWPQTGSGLFQRTDNDGPFVTSSLIHYFNANELASASRWDDLRTEATYATFQTSSITLVEDIPSSSYYDFASSSVQSMYFGRSPIPSNGERTVLLWIKPKKVGLTDDLQMLQWMGTTPGVNSALLIQSGGLAFRGSSNVLSQGIQGDFPSMSADLWYQVGYTYTPNVPADNFGIVTLFQNEYTSSFTASGIMSNLLYWEIGEIGTIPSKESRYSGSLAIQMIYTSSLSYDEIQQNYNYFNQFYN